MISLPIEIQIEIIPLLSSTSLIALSQTNRHFRRLIDPQKKQFVNRLLELECLPEYGGEVTINGQAKIIVPPGYVAYACTHCLKILSHTHFDNHSLLRVRFRKPPPESRVGQKLCGWTSGDAKAQGLHRQAELRNELNRIPPTEWNGEDPVDVLYSVRMNVHGYLWHIGSKRHRRMCNECKFTTGFWSRNAGARSQAWRAKSRSSDIGTATVPVITGRQRRCHDSTERYFPGLFPINPDIKYPERWKIYRNSDCDWWTLWSIRCAGCSVWQERAAFRKGSAYGVKATPADPDAWRQADWDGPHFEDWRCNHCHVKSVGQENLGKGLLEFWKRLVKHELSMFHLLLPWNEWTVEAIERATNHKYSWEEIVNKDSVASQAIRKAPTGREVEGMDAEQRRDYFGILQRWLKSLKDSDAVRKELMVRDDFRNWVEVYEILIRRIVGLEEGTRILEADPDKLVTYALSRQAALV